MKLSFSEEVKRRGMVYSASNTKTVKLLISTLSILAEAVLSLMAGSFLPELFSLAVECC